MENTSYIALSSQLNLKRQLDLLANNLANVNTDGFQADRMRFKQLVLRPARTDDLTFNATANIARDLTPGALVRAGNPLHLALPDRGYFAVLTARGERYTRSGEFVVDQDNRLTNLQGDVVLDSNFEPVTLPANYDAVEVTPEGRLSVRTSINAVTFDQFVADLAVVDFADTHALNKEGQRLLQTGQQPEQLAEPVVKQGYLEQSNVVAISELVALIDLQRHYSGVNKVIEQEDERNRAAIETFTKIG